MNKLTEWWIEDKKLEGTRLEEMNQQCPHDKKNENPEYWECYEEILRRRVPMGDTLLKHQLYVEESATSFINYLFDKYIDDDTLLITSVVEHDAVKAAVTAHNRDNKDHVRLHYFNGIDALNIGQVKEALMKKNYKNAFVYIIGTQITTGEWTSQKFYEKLRDYLLSKGLKVTMVIDDVHGLFLVPRDYSIFDYVISTAHALIRRWDMGIMWSKTDESFGGKYFEWLGTYIGLLSMMQDRQIKLSYFSYVMKEEFIEYLSNPFIELISDSVPHIFTLKIHCPPRFIYNDEMYQECKDNEVRLEAGNYETDDLFYIRLRGSQYITFPEMTPKAIELVRKILDRIVMFGEGNE